MTAGFGTSFTVVLVFVVLAGLAVLLGLTAVGALLFLRRSGSVPRAIHLIAVILLIEVIGVAGFGSLSFAAEAPVATAMIATLVIFPLIAVIVRARRTTRLAGTDLIATVAMAWSLPYLVGLAVFVGLTRTFEVVLGGGAPPAGLVGLGLFAAMASGVVVIIGVGLFTSRLSRRLVAHETEGSEQGE